MIYSRILGTGGHLPARVVANADLEAFVDTNDAWIRERNGVETRYYVDPGTSTSDLGVAAAERAIENSGVAREEIDLVISAMFLTAMVGNPMKKPSASPAAPWRRPIRPTGRSAP